MKDTNITRWRTGIKIFLTITFFFVITLLRSQVREIGPGFIGNNPARTVSGSASFSSGCPVCNPQGSFIDKAYLLQTGGSVRPDAGRPVILTTTSEKGGGSAANTTRPPQLNEWLDELITKIHQVESGGRLYPPDGDDGRAVGALQLHKAAIDDVNRYYKTNFKYSDRSDFPKARLIAALYIRMWMDIHKEEIAARIFNGGPRGWRKKSTDEYWEKIQGAK